MTLSGRDGALGPAPGSELRLRVLSSLALGAVALLTAWTGGWAFAALWLGAACAVVVEWLAMMRVRPETAIGTTAVAGLVALQVSLLGHAPLWALGAVGVVTAAILVLGAASRDRAWALCGFGYAAAAALVPVAARTHPLGGAGAVFWMFAVVWTTDVAAYFTGRSIGGPKLWPAVSPKKTWSGFAGGLAGGTVAGVAVAIVSDRSGQGWPFALGPTAVLSALASVASQAGDLAESALKRRFGVKDSGRLIPGHGGVMDRLDGFAAVAIVVGFVLLGEAAATAWAARP